MRQIFGTIFENVCMVIVCLHLTPGHVGVVSAYNAYIWLVSTLAMCLSTSHGIGTIVESVVKYQLLAFIFFVRAGAAGPLGVLPSPATLSSVAVSLSPITVTTPTVVALIPSVPQPYPVMSSSLHPTSLTFAASVAPQLITSLCSNSPPLFYSQASAMHPSPVVALSHPGLILVLSPACDSFPQALVQRVQAGQFVEMRDHLALLY